MAIPGLKLLIYRRPRYPKRIETRNGWIADQPHLRNPRYPWEKRRRRPRGFPTLHTNGHATQPRRPIQNPNQPATGAERPSQHPQSYPRNIGDRAISRGLPYQRQPDASQLPSSPEQLTGENRGGCSALMQEREAGQDIPQNHVKIPPRDSR